MTLTTNEILNKLVVLHTRSLPMYLSYAKPWHLREHQQAMETLENIVHLQKDMADRLAQMVMENNISPDYGEFPMAFTSLHDLSVEYLLKLCIERQRKEIAVYTKCVEMLATAPYAQAVAQEALGEAKGHLEALEAAAQSDPLEIPTH